MNKLKSLHAREILDSRGNPTVEVVATTARFTASAIVPSGASTGSHEALELRDGDKKRYGGKGVLRAVANVNGPIFRALKGMDVGQQRAIDEKMIALDGAPNKSRLGANAILGASLACAKVAALEAGLPLFQYLGRLAEVSRTVLPTPMMNIINGGVHANSGLEFQEMMIVPAGARNFAEALRTGAEIFHTLKGLLAELGLPTTVGDEGGFAPRLGSHEEALDLIVKAIKKAGYKPGKDVWLALDTASSEFSSGGRYSLKMGGKKKTVGSRELVSYFQGLVKKYPIFSIEDGCGEDDWDGWKLMTKRMGGRDRGGRRGKRRGKRGIQIVGDDLFVTNPERLGRGIEQGIGNSILIKLNQIGSLTETIDVIKQAHRAGYTCVVSHRSGETEDTTIAHLATGLATGQIKTGSLSRTDRVAKYNELLRIEESLGGKAKYAGKTIITNP